MYRAKHGITVFYVVDYHSQRYKVINLLKRFPFFELSVNTVKVFRSAVDFAFNAQFVKHLMQFTRDMTHHILPFALCLRNLFRYVIVTVWIQIPKTEVFKLAFDA